MILEFYAGTSYWLIDSDDEFILLLKDSNELTNALIFSDEAELESHFEKCPSDRNLDWTKKTVTAECLISFGRTPLENEQILDQLTWHADESTEEEDYF